MNYKYNYNTTIIKTDNQYLNLNIKDYNSAINKIKDELNTDINTKE